MSPDGWCMLVNGRQKLESYYKTSNHNRYIPCDTLWATKKGVNRRDAEFIFIDYIYTGKWIGYWNYDLLFLQGR